MLSLLLIKKGRVNNIKSIKVGDRVRIKNGCTKYEGKYNGEIGIVKKFYFGITDLPKNIPIGITNQHNKKSSYGYFYFRADDFDVIAEVDTTSCNDFMLDSNIENIIDNIGEEKMKSEKIMNLWRSNQGKVIGNAINKKENEILNLDPIYSSIKTHVEEIDKILSEQNFNKVSDEIQFKAYKLKTTDALVLQNREFGSKLQKDLDMQYIEICAMLSACDTYEQEMEVLKSYKIVGEDGKLVVVCGE